MTFTFFWPQDEWDEVDPGRNGELYMEFFFMEESSPHVFFPDNVGGVFGSKKTVAFIFVLGLGGPPPFKQSAGESFLATGKCVFFLSVSELVDDVTRSHSNDLDVLKTILVFPHENPLGESIGNTLW